MEGGGKQFRLLSRLLGKLRGEHKTVEKICSVSSSAFSDTTMCENTLHEELEEDVRIITPTLSNTTTHTPTTPPWGPTLSKNLINDQEFAAHIDLRYGGQYLTPEQLPEFCDQLHNLVQVVRNIQSYAKVTGEYPSILERRLEKEAEEVAALAAEARNAREVIARTRVQRRAVRAQRKHLMAYLDSLRDTEIRELENTVRLSDRKLYKNWESLKDSSDPADFEPLLNEIKTKQFALEGLVRLIDNRRNAISRNNTQARPQPLPPPTSLPFHSNTIDDFTTAASSASNGHRRDGQRSNARRRRKDGTREPKSVPVTVESENHGPQPQQVALFIHGTELPSGYRLGSDGTMALPARDSIRDILFFTSN